MNTRERDDLLATLARHRWFLRYTLRDLSDEQAAAHPTASALCLGGLIKHVASTEAAWMHFVTGGAGEMDATADPDRDGTFQMQPGDTVASVLANYAAVEQRTTDIVMGLADLDASHPLPDAPWFEQGAS